MTTAAAVIIAALLVVAIVAVRRLSVALRHDCGYVDCDQRDNPYHRHVERHDRSRRGW